MARGSERVNYLLLKRPPYRLLIVTSWPSIDIQLLLQQKCCDNSLLSSIWPLSGPLVTSIWALVSTNTLTMTKRMRGTSQTVHSGSPSYWISAKLDLLSMIRTHGAPTFFLTLSANDMNWNDLMIVLCKSENLPCSIEDIELYPKQFKTKLMNRNPILTARHFSRRFNSFVDNVMLSSHKPLGTITQYFWRVEFQFSGYFGCHKL